MIAQNVSFSLNDDPVSHGGLSQALKMLFTTGKNFPKVQPEN